MVRKTRKTPALVGTIALVAGCGSAARAEVSGVVVDARTGRAIPGARVTAQDGSATRTDADGRFTISISRGDGRELRASAQGREDARTRIDVRVDENASIVIQLVPAEDELAIDGERGETPPPDLAVDPDAVLRWLHAQDLERWLVRGVSEPDLDEARAHHADATRPCGDCHQATAEQTWTASEQWTLGSMTLGGSEVRDPACASCHDATTFAAAHGAGAATHASGACVACHDLGAGTPGSMRVYEHGALVAGAPATGLGSGAVCVECHRAVDAAPGHAPQADVVLGRGARTLADLGLGAPPHGAIADGCVACHGATWRGADAEELTLGHTFAVREASGGIARDACSSCHGEVAPESIARRDWDGDGTPGAVAEEHDRALARVRLQLEGRLRQARVQARCGAHAQTAVAFTEHHGALVLVDVRGVMLGDCDADGVLGAGEQAVSLDTLPREVRDSMWDLTLLERDGSRGVHNPDFAFALLGAIESRL